MSENNVNETVNENVTPAENAGEEIVVQNSMGKKILKVVGKCLAGAAAVIAGFFLGRASKGSDDNDDEESSEESEAT